MLCTRTWSEAVSCRRRCGRSRLVTATCWRITFGGFPSGPASVCWSWSAWPSHRSTQYADYSVTNTESAHSRDELGEDAVTLYALTVNVKYKLMEVRKLSGKKKTTTLVYVVFRDINESEILELDSVLIVRVSFRALTNTGKH